MGSGVIETPHASLKDWFLPLELRTRLKLDFHLRGLEPLLPVFGRACNPLHYFVVGYLFGGGGRIFTNNLRAPKPGALVVELLPR